MGTNCRQESRRGEADKLSGEAEATQTEARAAPKGDEEDGEDLQLRLAASSLATRTCQLPRGRSAAAGIPGPALVEMGGVGGCPPITSPGSHHGQCIISTAN